jgi:AraC-like DNA-binding protein
MKTLGHLVIEQITLGPGQEWMAPARGWRFLHVSSGAAYWLGSSRPRSLTEGEMLVIAPATTGLVRASQLSQVMLHAFIFAPDLLCGFFTLSERHFLEAGGAGPVQDVQFLPSTHPVTQQFAALARSRLRPDSLAQRVEVLSLVAAVFDEEIVRRRPPATLGTSAVHRFKQLIAQLPDMELIHHSPEHLARLCGCSLRHFNRLFRKFFKTSTRARQTELRLLKARQLLCETEQKIMQVALDCGYCNLSLFNALFKRRFGMTPSECRRQASKSKGKSKCLIAGLLLFFLTGIGALGRGTLAPHESRLGTPVPPLFSGQEAFNGAPYLLNGNFDLNHGPAGFHFSAMCGRPVTQI